MKVWWRLGGIALAVIVAALGQRLGQSIAGATEAWWRGTSVADQPLGRLLEQAAADANSQISTLPVNDPRLRMESVETGPGHRLTFRFAVRELDAPTDGQMQAVYAANRQRLCTGSLRSLLDRGAVFGYRYADERGRWIREDVVQASDCAAMTTSTSVPTAFDLALGAALVGSTVARVSVDDLVAAYRDNEFAAAARFEGQTSTQLNCITSPTAACQLLEVTGLVDEFGRDDRGVPSLALVTSDGSTRVPARFPDVEVGALAMIQKKRTTTVLCVLVSGSRLSRAPAGILLTRCTLL